MLTAGYWRSKFGGDRSAIGRTVMLDGKPREIIGVLPDAFRFLDRRRLARRAVSGSIAARCSSGKFSYTAIARLKPGVTHRAGERRRRAHDPDLADAFPPFPGATSRCSKRRASRRTSDSLKDDSSATCRHVLWVLMGTIGMVLLIACANVANLLLVRAESRQQELAVRAALGAGRGRIARELLLESVTLGAARRHRRPRRSRSARCGCWWRWRRATCRGSTTSRIDMPVLLFTLALSLAAGLLFGAIPGVQVRRRRSSRRRCAAAAGPPSASRERHRARNMLVVAQVALALVLLVSSGLMIRTFQALRDVDPGFTGPRRCRRCGCRFPTRRSRTNAAVVADAPGDPRQAGGGARRHVGRARLDRHDDRPGLARSALRRGPDATRESQIPPIRLFKFVSPGYMKTLGTPLVAGRDFTWTDIYELRPVAMVSENLARELWGQPAAALGKRIRPYAKGPGAKSSAWSATCATTA